MDTAISKKPAPGTTVYMASGSPIYHHDSIHYWITVGAVTPCGEWVQVGEVRHPLSASWHTRRVDAEASVADAIELTGRRYISRAEELRRRAAT